MDGPCDVGEPPDSPSPARRLLLGICLAIIGGASTWWLFLQIKGPWQETHPDINIFVLMLPMLPTLLLCVVGSAITFFAVDGLLNSGPQLEEDHKGGGT